MYSFYQRQPSSVSPLYRDLRWFSFQEPSNVNLRNVLTRQTCCGGAWYAGKESSISPRCLMRWMLSAENNLSSSTLFLHIPTTSANSTISTVTIAIAPQQVSSCPKRDSPKRVSYTARQNCNEQIRHVNTCNGQGSDRPKILLLWWASYFRKNGRSESWLCNSAIPLVNAGIYTVIGEQAVRDDVAMRQCKCWWCLGARCCHRDCGFRDSR